ncbi:MAG: helix-turn-helix transcriptional regulator [Ferruginibacter sp.]
MSRIKNNDLLRIRLSISQEAFAGYLGVNRSQLNMYERGLRSLPTPAVLKLANLEIIYHNFQQAKKGKAKSISLHPKAQEHHDNIKSQMKDHAAFCHAKKTVLQRKLNNMIEEHAKAEIWWQLLDEMLLDMPNEKQKSEDHLWLIMQKEQALKKITRHGIASQAKLQAVIHVLGAEADVYKNLHEKL